MSILDDIIERTSHLAGGGTAYQDPFVDPFDVNQTALHGLGGLGTLPGVDATAPYTLDLFSDIGIGKPWWWNSPDAGTQPTGTALGHKPPIDAPGGPFDPKAWMEQYGGGKAPYEKLVSVGKNGLPSTNGQWYLRPDTAAAFVAMDEAFRAQTGRNIRIVSAFRNFGTPYEAARGMDWRGSDHASGGAIDICGTSCSGDQLVELAWMKKNAAKFGFGVWGGAWGDDGHFSFSAGGFHGWASNYTSPSDADQQWIAAAGGASAPVITPAPMNGPVQTAVRPAVDPSRVLAMVPGAQQAPAFAPPYQMALPSVVADMLAPEPVMMRRGSRPRAPGPGGRLPVPKGLDNADANRALAEQMAAARGWTGEQWQAIRYIVEGHGKIPAESEWLGSAKNPTLPDAITAYGIGQRLIRAHPWLSEAEKQKYLTNVAYQIQWMFNYIQQRYGDPLSAWQYKVAHHNY